MLVHKKAQSLSSFAKKSSTKCVRSLNSNLYYVEAACTMMYRTRIDYKPRVYDVICIANANFLKYSDAKKAS